MTKAQLIESLKDYPDDVQVLIPGHSDCGDSYDLVTKVNPVIVERYDEFTWRGEFYNSKAGSIKAIALK